MKRHLIVPALSVAALIGAWLLAHGPDARDLVLRISPIPADALACVGPLLAAAAFERRDHLRRAWSLYGATAALLLVSGLANLFPSGDLRDSLRFFMTFLANAVTVVSLILFARTFSVAGIDLPGTRLTRTGALVVSLGIGVALATPSIYYEARQLVVGSYPVEAVLNIVGSIGDLVSLALIAPILLTALALRGGLLARPWILLTAASVSWLVYDLLGIVLPADGPAWLAMLNEAPRILALSLTFSSGLAQREISVGRVVEPAAQAVGT